MSASRCDYFSDHLLSKASKSSLELVLKEVGFFSSFVGNAFLLSVVDRTILSNTFSDTLFRIRTLPARTGGDFFSVLPLYVGVES